MTTNHGDLSVDSDEGYKHEGLLFYLLGETALKFVLWFMQTCLNRNWHTLQEEYKAHLLEQDIEGLSNPLTNLGILIFIGF